MEKLKEHTHNIIYILLVIVILLLLSGKKQGRYTLVSPITGGIGVYVLDTKTSQLWYRTPKNANMYLGTNKNPKMEVIRWSESQKTKPVKQAPLQSKSQDAEPVEK